MSVHYFGRRLPGKLWMMSMVSLSMTIVFVTGLLCQIFYLKRLAVYYAKALKPSVRLICNFIFLC